jgi:hypothetical protein
MAMPILTARHWASEYIKEATRMVDHFRQSHPFQDLVRAWRSGEVSSSGNLPGDVHYQFHGSGCIFQSPNRTVDLDFGPQGRCDGFDAWRVFQFATANYGEDAIPSLADFTEGILELEKSGEVKKPGWGPSPHLFYFSASLESQ